MRCAVLVGGAVSAHKGVNLPGVPLPIPSLTRKDTDDLEFALELGVDFVALSFVRSAADVRDLRKLIDDAGSRGARDREDREGRGGRRARRDPRRDRRGHGRARRPRRRDRAGAVPLLQKRIIRQLARARKAGDHGDADARVDDPPARADARRGERRRERDPRRHVGGDALRRDGGRRVPGRGGADDGPIARAVEPSLGYRHQIPEASDAPSVGNAMSNAACDLAEALRAAAILVPTFTGRTASMVARLRPRRPIVGLSHHQYALQQMALEWGVTPLLDPGVAGRRGSLERSRSRRRATRASSAGRPRRDHRGDAGQHPRLDERHQGRRPPSDWRRRPRTGAARMAEDGGSSSQPWSEVAFPARLDRGRRARASSRSSYYQPARARTCTRATPCRTRAAEVQKLRRQHATARAARRRLDERRGARARGAPPRPRQAGRAALHRARASSAG